MTIQLGGKAKGYNVVFNCDGVVEVADAVIVIACLLVQFVISKEP